MLGILFFSELFGDKLVCSYSCEMVYLLMLLWRATYYRDIFGNKVSNMHNRTKSIHFFWRTDIGCKFASSRHFHRQLHPYGLSS